MPWGVTKCKPSVELGSVGSTENEREWEEGG